MIQKLSAYSVQIYVNGNAEYFRYKTRKSAKKCVEKKLQEYAQKYNVNSCIMRQNYNRNLFLLFDRSGKYHIYAEIQLIYE